MLPLSPLAFTASGGAVNANSMRPLSVLDVGDRRSTGRVPTMRPLSPSTAIVPETSASSTEPLSESIDDVAVDVADVDAAVVGC